MGIFRVGERQLADGYRLMSHIHLPDGVLPAWLWLSGYAVAVLLIAALWRGGRTTAEPQRFALLGIFAAVMILVAMIEIPPFGFHFNLSVVSGIILGPRLAVLAALIVNLVLALIGHGGITVIGLNTFILSTEMIAGYYVFRLLSRVIRIRAGKAGFIATAAGLACGAGLAYGVLAVGSPWIDRSLQSAAGIEELGPGTAGPHLSLVRLAVIIFGIGAVGWVAEAVLSAAILGYLERIYPGLIAEGKVEQ